jgi:ATP-dependent DNA helicase RecQ
MEFLRLQLDDPSAESCGRCANCIGQRLTVELDQVLIRLAIDHLRSSSVELAPRKQWPAGIEGPRGRIPENVQLQPGRALSIYNDGGWGALVRSGKHYDGAYSHELVDASVRLIERFWRPQPPPAWVTCVPSLAHPELVPSFALRLAEGLDLTFAMPVVRTTERPPQKDQENGAKQLMNVLGAFEVRGALPDGSVLLVDDIRDSGWTLTVVGQLLLEAGSGPVHPFVLALAVSS